MSVIATTTLDNDEDLMMSRRLWDDIRKKGFEGAGEKSESEIDSDDGEETKAAREASDFSDEDDDDEEGEDEMSSGDELFDHKEAHVAAMAEQMEANLDKKKTYQMSVDRKMAGKEYKK